MRTRWLIDFDGCICPTLNTMVELLNTEFGTSFTTEGVADITEFWKSVPEPLMHWAWSDKCFDSPAFLDRMRPFPGSLETIQSLLDLECPVVIVTDRPRRHLPWVRNWFARHNLVLPIVSSESRNDNKVAFVGEYQITTVVEDSAAHAAHYLTESIQKLFLFTTSWNKRVVLVPPAERLDSWTDLHARIKEEHDR